MDYIERIENEELYVLCLNTIEDEIGVYCVEGKEYKVIDYLEDKSSGDCFIIETEDEEEMQITVDDIDFEIVK